MVNPMKTLLSVALLLFATQAHACTGQTPCALGERSYHVLEPDGWDGVTPLPVLLHFHGWQRQGSLIVQHDRIAGATRRRGVLLVVPNGRNRTWYFRTSTTPDIAFARAVIDDVASRYPIDRDQIFASGYSFGAIMAWRFVCHDGADIAALLAISGVLPQETECDTHPREVRQVFGFDDDVLRYPFGPNGETDHPVALWRADMGCGEGEVVGDWQQRPWLTLTRTEWACEAGQVALDTHPGGHFIPHGWIARQLDELLGLPNTYP